MSRYREEKKPFPVVLVVASVLGGLFLVCGGIGAVMFLSLVGRAASATQLANSTPAVVTPVTIGVEHRIGDLGITVIAANHGSMSYRAMTNYVEVGKAMCASFKVVNYNQNKLHNIGPATPKAYMIDDLGNRYEAMYPKDGYGFIHAMDSQIGPDDALVIRSEVKDGVMDRLAFTRPPIGCKMVTIYISAEPYGGAGYLSFTAQNK